MACAFFVGRQICDWCGRPREEHDAFPCSECGGSGSTPDPFDRDSQRRGIPIYLWRRIPCECRSDDHGLIRIGGFVDRKGVPLEDDELEKRGIIRRPQDQGRAR
jgi:hypothetical protein